MASNLNDPRQFGSTDFFQTQLAPRLFSNAVGSTRSSSKLCASQADEAVNAGRRLAVDANLLDAPVCFNIGSVPLFFLRNNPSQTHNTCLQR